MFEDDFALLIVSVILHIPTSASLDKLLLGFYCTLLRHHGRFGRILVGFASVLYVEYCVEDSVDW